MEQIVLDLGDTELHHLKIIRQIDVIFVKKVCLKNFYKKQKNTRWHMLQKVLNMDDLGDYRPGMQAITELGIKSPLRAAELTKQKSENYPIR